MAETKLVLGKTEEDVPLVNKSLPLWKQQHTLTKAVHHLIKTTALLDSVDHLCLCLAVTLGLVGEVGGVRQERLDGK